MTSDGRQTEAYHNSSPEHEGKNGPVYNMQSFKRLIFLPEAIQNLNQNQQLIYLHLVDLYRSCSKYNPGVKNGPA